MPGAVNFNHYGAGSNFETVYMDMATARNHVTFIADSEGVIVEDDESVAINN